MVEYSHQPARLSLSRARSDPKGSDLRNNGGGAVKRVIAYIDGYNLYYGLLKGSCNKWLDPVAFVRSFMRPDQELVGVRYFTAPIKTHPHNLAAIDRQKIYLHALSTIPQVQVIQGFYSKNKTLAPAIENRCRGCEVSKGGYIPVIKLEEKRSDVNFAISVLMDAFNDNAESFFLFTGDSDQLGTVETVRKRLCKRVCVFNPHAGISIALKTASSYYQNIPRDLPGKCQLPDAIPVGTHGNFIRRPDAWK